MKMNYIFEASGLTQCIAKRVRSQNNEQKTKSQELFCKWISTQKRHKSDMPLRGPERPVDGLLLL